MTPRLFAESLHGATRVFGRLDGTSIPAWEELSEESKALAEAAVHKLLSELPHSPHSLHTVWAEPLLEAGWTAGDTYDAVAKKHPCLVPYEQLPVKEMVKDAIWSALIEVFRTLVEY